MDCSPIAAMPALEDLHQEVLSFYEQYRAVAVDWTKLDWSSHGPAALFEQFKIAGGWADFFITSLLDFENRRNCVIGDFEGTKVQLEKAIEAALVKGGKRLILDGFAYQERAAFARVDVGSLVWDCARFDKKLEQLNATLLLLKTKAKLFTDFKGDAKTASSLMNFGNLLGELK